jgi:hypothetical protein
MELLAQCQQVVLGEQAMEVLVQTLQHQLAMAMAVQVVVVVEQTHGTAVAVVTVGLVEQVLLALFIYITKEYEQWQHMQS